MMTKGEESSTTFNARASSSAEIPSTTGSASPTIQRNEIRWYLNTDCITTYIMSLTGHLSLQDLGDLQHLCGMVHDVWREWCPDVFWRKMDDPLDEALRKAEQEVMVWARRHEADGRYKDAEYLIRRANSGLHTKESLKHMWSHLSTDILPTMVAMYEKMGDYTAEEECQEKLVELLFSATSQEQVNEEQRQAVLALSRMLSSFHKRILDLVPNFEANDLFITYRASVLDVVLLNEILLKKGLITSETNEKHTCTSLHIAVKENAINLARQLIKMGADVNSEDWKKQTPLHVAATCARSEIIELLLDNQAKIEAVDHFRNTPLHAAVEGKCPQDTVAYLVNAKADLNASNKYGDTALNFAIKLDLPATASLLLEKGANVKASNDGDKPLSIAVCWGRTWAIDLLLKYRANLARNHREAYDVLKVAVKMNRDSIVQILLNRIEISRSPSYEENNYDGLLVLLCAINDDDVPMVEMLLKAGIGIDERYYDGDTALHQAVVGGRDPHERIVKLLLEHDAVGLERANWYGDTALHLAVRLSRRNMLVILLRHKPHELPILCNMQNRHGETPLDIARAEAKGKEDPRVEVSVLYLLENALKLVSATGLHNRMGEEVWNSEFV